MGFDGHVCQLLKLANVLKCVRYTAKQKNGLMDNKTDDENVTTLCLPIAGNKNGETILNYY